MTLPPQSFRLTGLITPEVVHSKELQPPSPATNETINKDSEIDEFPQSSNSAAIVNFVSTFIYNLDVSPTPGEEDLTAIRGLGWSLRVSSFRIWARKKFPKIMKFLEAPSAYPGRRICSIHNGLSLPILFNLHDLILDEVRMPSASFCSQELGNKYLTTFKDINRIWDEGYRGPEPSGVKNLYQPLKNHPLYQETHCAGCCLRRILSDYNVLAVLLIAVRFREFEGRAREREVTDYLEASWDVLAEKIPHVLGSREDAIRARDNMELAAIRLSKQWESLGKGEVERGLK